MLTINQVSKYFGDVEAVKNVSFHIEKGTTFALLGTNGAGKSTLIHMIIGLITPHKGTITFSKNQLELIGVVFQTSRLDEEFTIEENLITRAKLYGISHKEAKTRVNDLLELTHLSNIRHRKYRHLSGGEKRKADIIRAIVHKPSFLILDEPTTGLDVESRKEVWKILNDLQAQHKLTILLTTHYIEEAEYADYVVIMHEGNIKIEGSPHELKKRYSQPVLIIHTLKPRKIINYLNKQDLSFECSHNKISISLVTSMQALPILNDLHALITDFSIETAHLEQVFLNIAKHIKDGEIL